MFVLSNSSRKQIIVVGVVMQKEFEATGRIAVVVNVDE